MFQTSNQSVSNHNNIVFDGSKGHDYHQLVQLWSSGFRQTLFVFNFNLKNESMTNKSRNISTSKVHKGAAFDLNSQKILISPKLQ